VSERDLKYRIVEQLLEIFNDKGPVIGSRRASSERGYDAKIVG
jgi:hypothetical protein